MTTSPTATYVEAAAPFDALTTALTNAGLKVTIIERPRKIKVSDPRGHASMADEITLRPNTIGTLKWYWSWNAPIAPASDIDHLVHRIKHVVASPPPPGF
jgi:hypothetical protein